MVPLAAACARGMLWTLEIAQRGAHDARSRMYHQASSGQRHIRHRTVAGGRCIRSNSIASIELRARELTSSIRGVSV